MLRLRLASIAVASAARTSVRAMHTHSSAPSISAATARSAGVAAQPIAMAPAAGRSVTTRAAAEQTPEGQRALATMKSMLSATANNASLSTAMRAKSTSAPATASSMLSIPLTEAWPNAPKPEYVAASSGLQSPAQCTVLPNGLRVVSIEAAGHISAVGAFVHTGCRYETEEYLGASHFLDRLACRSTKRRSAEDVERETEALGTNPHCITSRENVVYSAISFSSELPQLIDLVGDLVCNPQLTQDEVELARQTIEFEYKTAPDLHDRILIDKFHEVAFGGSALAAGLNCPQSRLPLMTRDKLLAFRRSHIIAPRTTVGVLGSMKHSEVVELVSRHFANLPTHPPSAAELEQILKGQEPVPTPPSSAATVTPPQDLADVTRERAARYSGGFAFIRHPPHTNPLFRNFVQLMLGFEIPGCTSEEWAELALLHVILGGGNTFSAGGPGKGVLSRLYADVLHAHPKVENAIAILSSYYDTGAFSLHIMCQPDYAETAVQILAYQAFRVSRDIQVSELQRAKNQVKSLLLMAYESRPLLLDDALRHQAVFKKSVSVAEICDKIDKVTPANVMAVAAKMLTSNPTFVVMGDEQYLPPSSVEYIRRTFPLRK
ncbi:hypothetical protein CAOG_06706 [Capsaspora owczarzaki ATCC 30864]|uniref:Mitochondrial processing peptidase alpha subunit n=1 Tax=Capsaspora owczarzaki (strain ATCC 30864) TaxID=595528 RepID=A0A0D2WVR1_CAPO3|nr:hypothetical protein CAOG_06706 [Capsaspora owczarzaki ATCC 30864]KJE96368.1 hypothetical protein CAOG_006706 [Capsaspora owczarzaki ATCC 30864]|eukprot:XP_004344327.1 hypothetical protein CAOG_06706 [Capsaspora owczarzaki ATCC 30864]